MKILSGSRHHAAGDYCGSADNVTLMPIDWTQICKKYKGKWVALLDDERTVVGSGASIEKVLAEARKRGHKDPIVMRVPTKILPFVGGLWL